MPVEVVFFNVGQGDCTLLWFYDRANRNVGTHAVLIDSGSSQAVAPLNPGPSLQSARAKDQMIGRLKSKLDSYLSRLKNPYVLDCLIVTHPDEDHFNLLEEVLLSDLDPPQLKYTIRQVRYGLSPWDYKERGGDFMWTLFHHWDTLGGPSGQKVENEPLQVTMPTSPQPVLPGITGANLYMVGSVLGPERPTDWDKYETGKKEHIANAGSLVTVLQGEPDAHGRRQKVLLMADAVEINERYLQGAVGTLCSRESNLWLKLGHHGSVTSNTDEWIKHTTPDGLFVSTGVKAFGGKSATCTVGNITNRLLPAFNSVRPAPGPFPRQVTVPPNWGYVVQDDMAGSPTLGRFLHQPLTNNDALFSSLATPAGPNGWAGVDWHLRLDNSTSGSYDIWYE